ncbi:F-box protein At3g07870-like [Cornus florida]|uniref:F-box protein At3g07870-like n=1 Tax=Cornus florida TaxID=4283 RepID=UPI0028A06191|nr:F-box protein At3g07870-like [Cornus florida]XP_059649195.1 F-box protein At3g07870-like [Cornus florida]XP_059649196.1 F-box protein At3g07870-like [Cornus florida]XP_059649197.1 F-box protein At3g07870-like [Cornus florida]XP_059649198.1 F-box protein At3g07870-like [Cornus florida]XP_059649199.1 F-box protein At3g07870-like [Cornus florida]
MVVNDVVDDSQRSFLSAGYVFKRKRPIEHKFKIVNSCHGFLCLCEPSNNEPVVVCNPIAGEYTNLPVAQKYGEKGLAGCGFGFSPRTNQYKVIRMICQMIFGESSLTNLRRTEIHTLGTGSWKSIGGCPDPLYGLAFPTYLEGCIHWICIEPRTFPNYIVSFNFDNEQFQSVPPPPRKSDGTDELSFEAMSNVSMGVLEGCLCICEASNYINIWIMKKYGVQESWTKIFSIDTDERCPIGLYQPIKYLKDGALLMFHYFTSSLNCYDPNEPKFKCLKVFGIDSKFEAIAHIPSFISLKEAVTGDNAVVRNIYSRCAAFKVPEETLDLSLMEKVRDTTFDSDNSSSGADKWRSHLFVFDTFTYIGRCSGFE